MLVSTSRKPSRRTRAFTRALAAYLGVHSLNRGKRSLSELFEMASEDDGRLVMVGERMGNPTLLTFYKEGVPLFWIAFTSPPIRRADVDVRILPIEVEGRGELCDCLREFFENDVPSQSEARKTLKVGANELELYTCGERVLTLKLRGFGRGVHGHSV